MDCMTCDNGNGAGGCVYQICCIDYAEWRPIPPKWEPIDTAPKEGQHLLLWRNDICFCGYYSGFRGGSWIVNAEGLPVIEPPPTHWRDLPAPPQACT